MAGIWGAMGSGMGGALGAAAIPGILSMLFGGNDMNKRMRERALQEFDPFNLGQSRDAFFKQTVGGEGFNAARNEMLGGAQAAQGALGRQLAQTGMGRTGVGTSMMGAMAASPGIHLGKLTSDAWNGALTQAMQRAAQRAGIMQGMPVNNMTLPLFGAGMGALAPYMFRRMNRPGGGNPHDYSQWDNMPEYGPGNIGNIIQAMSRMSGNMGPYYGG